MPLTQNVGGQTWPRDHPPSLDLIQGSTEFSDVLLSATSSSTASMASPPRTPTSTDEACEVYNQYFRQAPDCLLRVPDAVLTGSQEYMPREERSPAVRPENVLNTYNTATYPNWAPAGKSINAGIPTDTGGDPTDLMRILAGGQGVEGFRNGDEEHMGNVPSSTSLPATDAYLHNAFEARCVDPQSTLLHHGQVERGAMAVASTELGGQAPAVADKSVAPHRPLLILPPAILGARAHGLNEKEDLIEVSPGTNLVPAVDATLDDRARRRTMRSRGIVDKPGTRFKCEECTDAKGSPVTFNCPKDLGRHQRTTRAHNASAVWQCECGRSGTRKDAWKSHRKHCKLDEL